MILNQIFLELTILFDPGGGDGINFFPLEAITNNSFEAFSFDNKNTTILREIFLDNKLIKVMLIRNISIKIFL